MLKISFYLSDEYSKWGLWKDLLRPPLPLVPPAVVEMKTQTQSAPHLLGVLHRAAAPTGELRGTDGLTWTCCTAADRKNDTARQTELIITPSHRSQPLSRIVQTLGEKTQNWKLAAACCWEKSRGYRQLFALSRKRASSVIFPSWSVLSVITAVHCSQFSAVKRLS